MKGGEFCPKGSDTTCLGGRSAQSSARRAFGDGHCMEGDGEIPSVVLRQCESGASFWLLSGRYKKFACGKMLDDHIDRPVDGAEILVNDLQRVPA